MRKAALFALASCMILSYACTDEGIPVSQQNQNEETLAVDDNDVTGDEVAAIANTLFPGKATSRSGGLSIAEFSEARTTTIYVVNYPEDGGFLLLSGKKSHSPVLAYSDTGHFCIDDAPPPVKEWLKNTSADVYDSPNLTPDSLQRIAREWSRLGISTMIENPVDRTLQYLSEEKYMESQRMIMPYVNAWQQEGYTVYEYPQYEERYGEVMEDGTRLGNIARAGVSPLYEEDFWALAYIIEKEMGSVHGMDRTDEPKWSQSNGYNAAFPILSDGSHALAGCGPIALGQLMYNRKYPKSIKWDDVTRAGTANEYTANIVYEIAMKSKAKFEPGATSTTMDNLNNALKSYGYSTKKGSFDESKMTTPCIVSSKLKEPGKKEVGHAWLVSNGAQTMSSRYIELWIFNYDFAIEKAYSGYTDIVTTSSYYVNWGWGGYCDGFYGKIKNALPSRDFEKNTTSDMIYDIRTP